MSKTLKLVAILAAATFTLAACGINTDTSSNSSSAGKTSSKHNDADVSFAQEMIPHHAQAVEMAKMAKKSQASDPKVKALAQDIQAAQGPEIATMSAWLKTWDEKVPPTDSSTGYTGDLGDMGDMGAMGNGDMPGMMTSDQMTQLGKASGTSFDRMWLQMMIQHHQGAVEMAKSEQNDGQNVHAINLAKKIEAAQMAEISQMKHMLGG